MSNVIASKGRKMMKMKLTVQPYVLVLERNDEQNDYYIIFNGITYKFHRLIPAIESCFKLFFVLNIEYPPECVQIWQIVEKYVFNIKPSLKSVKPCVHRFLCKLNNVST